MRLGQPIAHKKIGCDLDVGKALIHCEHHVEGIFYFLNFQRFVQVGQRGFVCRFETDVDIRLYRHAVERLEERGMQILV